MIALDMNVIVRLVTADDPGQLEVARSVFESDTLWICKTVFLETEWVLRYSYELDRTTLCEVFRKLLGYPHLQAEDREEVLRALALHERGFDFADAMHLASCGAADRFVTFDRGIAKAARDLDEGPAVDLLGA